MQMHTHETIVRNHVYKALGPWGFFTVTCQWAFTISSQGQFLPSPVVSQESVPVMSFAQQLGQKSLAAHVASRNSWVEETLQSLMQNCERAAAEGRCNSYVYAFQPSLSAEAAVALLDQRLADLVFTQKQVSLDSGMVFTIVYWSMASKVPDKTNTAPQGIKGTCPICRESRPLVALTPCGHTVCQLCQSTGLRQCPMCRENLTGATRALFIG